MNHQTNLFGEGPPPPVPCPTCEGSGTVSPDALRRRLEDAPGQVGRDHPETSRRAAASSPPRFGTQRARVLACLEAEPATAAELAARTGMSRNQTATRLGELREGGFVTYLRTPEGDRVERPTGPRDSGLVQCLTALGRETVNNLLTPA